MVGLQKVQVSSHQAWSANNIRHMRICEPIMNQQAHWRWSTRKTNRHPRARTPALVMERIDWNETEVDVRWSPPTVAIVMEMRTRNTQTHRLGCGGHNIINRLHRLICPPRRRNKMTVKARVSSVRQVDKWRTGRRNSSFILLDAEDTNNSRSRFDWNGVGGWKHS